MLCYVGSLADNMKSVISGDAGLHGSTNYLVLGLSAAAVVVSIVYATVVVRCAPPHCTLRSAQCHLHLKALA